MKLKRHALILDDDDAVSLLCVRVLANLGFSVTTAASLAQAELIMRLSQVDLLVCDIGLPDGNGLDFLRRLRSKNDRTPAVVISGAPPDDVEERCGLLDVARLLLKPFTINHFKNAVLEATSASAERRSS